MYACKYCIDLIVKIQSPRKQLFDKIIELKVH